MKNFLLGLIGALLIIENTFLAFILFCPIAKRIYIKEHVNSAIIEMNPIIAVPEVEDKRA